MTADSLARAQAQVAAALPALIRKALKDCREVSREAPPADHRKGTLYHGACRAALSRLDLLLRLARSLSGEPAAAGPAETAGEEAAALAARLREARAGLARLPDAPESPDSPSSSGSGTASTDS